MPRQARIQSPTDYYHIMMRGNNRENIFKEDKQKERFLMSLNSEDEELLIEIAAYCIMDNHTHLVAKGNPLDLAQAIKRINIKYAMSFNKERGRIGHVFQDRFKSEIISDDKYLLAVTRYVHNNPVNAKMVKSPGDYYWSSYNEYMNKNIIVDTKQKEFVLGYFSQNLEQFQQFHFEEDDAEYLETKEDLKNKRLEKGQEIISRYFHKRGLTEAKQILNNPDSLDEIIKELLKKSRLSHRQIANLLEINNNIVHKVSLDRE